MFKEELESPSSDHYNELIFSQSVDEPYIKKEPNSAQFSKGTFSPPQQQLQQQQQMLNQFSSILSVIYQTSKVIHQTRKMD